ncbi:MAG: T9SS type A sorting domain-containing protein [Saprospiraceae bacterium]
MKIYSLIRILVTLVAIANFNILSLRAQCSPPWREGCSDINVLCSLSELDGYSCTSLSHSNPSPCNPLCPSGIAPSKTVWWGFVSNGGSVTVEIDVSNCIVNGTGLQMGLQIGCSCSGYLACSGSCAGPGVYTMTGILPACKYLQLFVDGCGGDICDFSFTISGPGALPPQAPVIGPISGSRNVCKGVCNVKYFANPGTSCVSPKYQWTLDGMNVGTNSKEVTLDFPEEGEFTLCLAAKITAFTTNPCDVKEECITVKSLKAPERRGNDRYICPDRLPFRWFDQFISQTGEYRTELTGSACCKFDSVLQFIVLDPPESPDVYFIGCSTSDPYIDSTTRLSFNSCQSNKRINLPNSTSPWRCDSSYFLNAIFLNYNLSFKTSCIDSFRLETKLENLTDTCGITGLQTSYSYSWYLASDTTHRLIGSEAFLPVTEKQDYCVDLSVNAKLGDKIKNCTYTFCEHIDEDSFRPEALCPLGDTFLIPNHSAFYTIDTMRLLPGTRNHRWTIRNGTIDTPNNGQDSTSIQVTWDSTAVEGQICYQYRNACLASKECCQSVKAIITSEHSDENSETLEIRPNPFREEIFLHNRGDIPIRKVELLDEQGKRVLYLESTISHDHSIVIPTEAVPSGIYFLVCYTDKGSVVKRLMRM